MDKLKLLIVDDEEGIIDMFEHIYRDKGYTVFSATDGIKAVEIFQKERPDVVFIDVHMPFSPIDGNQTLERIKKIDKDANCVMTSRIEEPPVVAKSKALGALHYLSKPYEIDDLDECIEEIREKLKKS
jgi:CheY-like chemotaxis protein